MQKIKWPDDPLIDTVDFANKPVKPVLNKLCNSRNCITHSMASSGVYDDLLKSMGKGVEACDARKLPPKFRDIVSNLKKKAHAIARDSSSNALPDDHVNNFRDLLTKTTKKLNKLARVPSHNPDNLLFERLQTSLDDMGSLHFRVKSQDGVSVSIAGIITNSEAKKFWCDSFGSKVCT